VGHFFCAVDWDKVVSVFSAALTPIIAITTTFVAIQQFKLNRNQFRWNLFDRRLKVFEASIELIAVVLRTGRVSQDDLTKFLVGTSERDFLFGADIGAHLDAIYNNAAAIHAIGHPVPQQQAVQHQTHATWFSGKTEETRRLFATYLAFRKSG